MAEIGIAGNFRQTRYMYNVMSMKVLTNMAHMQYHPR